MKNFLITVIKGVISFIILTFFILVFWAMIVAMLKHFDESFANVDKTIVLAVVSAIASIITLIISKSIDRNSVAFSEKKKTNQPVYENLIKDIITAEKSKEVIKNEYSAFVLSHANDSIYSEFLKYCDSDNVKADNLFLAIRKELKLTNRTSH